MWTTIQLREHGRATCYGGAVAARLADHRGRLAGDGRLVDRRDALDDLTVAGDDVAGLNHDHIALAERATGHLGLSAIRLEVKPASWPSRRGCKNLPQALAACALPRPSAIASAKFANRTVNHSHKATHPMNDAAEAPTLAPTSACTHRIVVRIDTTKTTNMTGFRTWSRGLSFDHRVNDGALDDGRLEQGLRCGGFGHGFLPESELVPFPGRPPRRCASASGVIAAVSASRCGHQLQMLDDRPERQGRDVCQCADDDHDGNQPADEHRRVRGERARRHRHGLLRGQRPGHCEHQDDEPVAGQEHDQAQGEVVEGVVRTVAGEC